MRILKIWLTLFFIVFPVLIFADVPVVTASSTNSVDRLAQLERQVQYLQQLNLPARMAKLQQTVQDLRGIIEVQGHEIQQLQVQLRNQSKGQTSSQTPSVYSPAAAPVSLTPVSAMPIAAHAVSKAKPAVLPKTTAVSKQDEDTQAYQAAFDLITNKQYSEAIPALQAYLKQYPDSQYDVNAHYWLGELFALAGQNDQAVSELNTVVTNYADSNKAPDALLKLGSMSYDQSQWEQAKQYWKRIISKYPNSSSARIANTNLQKLEQAGY